jgi:hypothetical protein
MSSAGKIVAHLKRLVALMDIEQILLPIVWYVIADRRR